MDAITQQALEKLFRKAERKAITSSEGPTPSLEFTEASLPAYNITMTHERLTGIHSEIRDCASTGAIDIDWDRRAGDAGQIKRIRLADATRLASYLGWEPRWEIQTEAEVAIGAWRGQWRVDEIWARWQRDKSVRSIRVDR